MKYIQQEMKVYKCSYFNSKECVQLTESVNNGQRNWI